MLIMNVVRSSKVLYFGRRNHDKVYWAVMAWWDNNRGGIQLQRESSRVYQSVQHVDDRS